MHVFRDLVVVCWVSITTCTHNMFLLCNIFSGCFWSKVRVTGYVMGRSQWFRLTNREAFTRH